MEKVTVRLATGQASIVNSREIVDICFQHLVAVSSANCNSLIDKVPWFEGVKDIRELRPLLQRS